MAWTERYVSVTGGGAHDGTTEADAWTLAEALAADAGGQRINVKAGTYTAAARTFSVAGTSSSGVWYRGYNTTIGDIDTDNTLTKPVIQCGSNSQTLSGAHHIFSNLDISGAVAGTLVAVSGAHVHLDRVRIENTDSGSTSYAVRATGNGFYLTRSWIKANTACNYVAILEERGCIQGNVFRGGKSGLLIDTTSGFCGVLFNVFDDQADNYGLDCTLTTGGSCVIVGNTFYAPGLRCIRVSATQAALLVISGNILANSGQYGIATVSGTVRAHRLANDFYSNSSGTESGFGDWPSLAEKSESSSPFTNAASHDFSVVTGALAKAAGAGGGFENESYTSYLDIGAVQRQESSGGGGAGPLLNGRLVA